MPTLGTLADWVKTEAGNAITLIFIIFAVGSLIKQQIGKMLGLFILAGVVYFVIGDPESIMKAVQVIFSKVIRGGGGGEG